VVDEEGWELTKVEDISAAFVSYYKELFTSKGTVGKKEFLEGM
jgi:hypothetical protein